MRTAILSTLLSFGFGFLSCQRPTSLPSLGVVKPEQLCSDVKRCDVRGDEAVSTISGSKQPPIHLAEHQGPESYLGKVAPKRNGNSALKTCGGDVSHDDWLETGPAARTVELADQGKQQLRAALKTHLGQQLLEHPEALAGQTATIDAVVEGASQGLGLSRVGMLSQTYWLTDAAFERRVGQCGEEEYKNVIYSLTLLRLSDLTHKELEAKLLAGLLAKLPGPGSAEARSDGGELAREPDAVTAEPAAPALVSDGGVASDPRQAHQALLRELAYGAVQSLASELRTIAALGFDEP
jgi:hypothetical protein